MSLRAELEALRAELAAAPDRVAFADATWVKLTDVPAQITDHEGPEAAALYDLLCDMVAACTVQLGRANWRLTREVPGSGRTRALSNAGELVRRQWFLRRRARSA